MGSGDFQEELRSVMYKNIDPRRYIEDKFVICGTKLWPACSQKWMRFYSGKLISIGKPVRGDPIFTVNGQPMLADAV